MTRETIAERISETGIDTERFVDVQEGSKACLDHTRLEPDDVSGNYGVYATAGDELVIIDVDDYDDVEDASGLLAALDLPETLTETTPHGGEHRFYRVEMSEDGRMPAAALKDALGVMNPKPSWGEVRVANQYVVAAGSELDGCDKEWCDECATDEGGRYELKDDRPIATIAAGTLIDALERDVNYREDQDEQESAEKTPTSAAETPDDPDGRIEYALEESNHEKLKRLWRGDYSDYGGDRSEAECALAAMLGWWLGGDKKEVARQMDRADTQKWSERSDDSYRESVLEAVDQLTEFYSPRESREKPPEPPGVPEAVADGGATSVDSGSSSAPTGPSLDPSYVATWAGLGEDEDVSDLNDRERAASVWDLLKTTDDFDVRVRRDNGSFWAYDAGVWKPEGERALRHAARQGLGSMNYGANVLSEMKAQASADPLVEVEADDFGLEPGKLAVENGLLRLEDAAERNDDAVRDLEPEDYALTRLPVTYDPEAEYDEWAGLVEEWAEHGRADALQEYVGYCLHVGAMPIHRALLLVGSGANGKGTFLSVVRALLGRENTSSIELQTLANERDAVADFYGSLANIDDDLSARKLGSGLGMFKKLVAGDRVRGRRLYEDGFEFDATGKHLYAANEVPQVDVPDDDEAFWRRWLLVEFPNHYPPSERDPELRDRLVEPESLSGVLNWAIDGWARLMEQGHFTNEERYAQEKRERWQAWGESVDKFISECLERDESADRITTGDVHRRYSAWCRENNQDIVGQQELTNKLKKEDYGYGQSVRIDGKVQRGFKTLGFSDEVPQLSDTPERGSPDDSTQQRF